MTMPPTQDTPPLKARVVSVAICKDPKCPYTPSPHLVVRSLEVPLDEDNATAISYTWGEFNRQHAFIGHSMDEGRQAITLELGEEWTVEDVIERLAELSSNGPIWLDQLCIVQRDETIRENLARIPTIFNTFQVVALMPGHPCKCLHEFVSEAKLLPAHQSKDVRSKAFYQCLRKYGYCINFMGSSSWFNRLWTRQELMHSRSIRCVWASKIISPCVPYKDAVTVDAAQLLRYSALKRQKFIDQGMPSLIAHTMLWVYLTSTESYASKEIPAYQYKFDTVDHEKSLPTYFYEFLNGEPLHKASSTGSCQSHSLEKLHQDLIFMSMSFEVDLSTRTSTDLQDYVLAIFPEWPLYVAPEEPKTHEMHCLMQDAFNQLHVKQHVTFLSTAPQGLFDETTRGSAVWHPDYYHRILQSVKAPSEISLRDIYGPINASMFLAVIDKSAMPIVFGCSESPISTTARDFHTYSTELISKHGKEEAKLIIIKQIQSVIQKWATPFFDAFRMHMVGFHPRYSEETTDELKAQSILRCWLQLELFDEDDYAEQFAARWGRLFDKDSWNVEDVAKALYTLMTIALRVNEKVCEKSDVRIMLSGDDSQMMRLGFYRGSIDLSSLGSGAERQHEIMTVRMDDSSRREQSEQGPLLCEVIQEERPMMDGDYFTDGKPCYKVFAVWIPLQGMTQGTPEYNAKALNPWRRDKRDAWLF